MYNHSRIIRHQKAEDSESKPNPRPSQASSPVQPKDTTQSPKLPEVEQSIESVQLPTLAERWSALDAKLPISFLDSQWQQELREIEWEHEKDVWESCPYD
jgi:hypothetical protein